ncbi:hypothetical protein GGI19_005672 [Coemansia pectinata]|uniref:Endoplasmic reticulum junction formation protein lunapark n=1 Tax=Coemansia pectinata TaxID=1052879 RepID=A0A9W8GT96_9FUNG|nr:hypothetical protein GGI19_005672 [Coemansia pectinata]
MSVTWVAYLAGFIFYVWPDRYGRQAPVFLVHLVSVILIPVFIYYGARGIRSVGQRIVSRHDRKIVRLRKELKERLDELKKKTAFDSTKNLIDRYSTGGGAKPDESVQKPGPQPNALSKLKQQQLLDEKNRRRTMPNFGTTGSRATTSAAVGSAPTSPDPASSLNPKGAPVQLSRNPGLLPGDQVQQQPPPHFALPETGVVKVGQSSGQAQAKSTAATASRPWLDKLVDQLVGDTSGIDEKYALICRHCYAHNGLVLVDEINDIQYTCPKCGKFNPSNRAIRAAAAATTAPATQLVDYQSSRTVEHSDQGEPETTSSRGDKSLQKARYTAVDDDDGSASDSAAGFDVSKVNTRPRRSGRAARDTSARPVSAATSDTDGHDSKPQQPEQQPQTEHATETAPQQPQQKQQQKLTPKKRKGNKAKRSL